MKACRAVAYILFGFLPVLSASDVGYYGMIKSQMYHQSPTTAPAILSSNGYMFNAFAIANTNGALSNATIRISSTGATKSLLPDTNGLSWRFEDDFNSLTALDAAYPAGSLFSRVSYTMTLDTAHDGIQTGSLDFWLLGVVALSYPPTPQLSNLPDGQSIDTTRDFTLTWNTLSGSSLDIVQLTVMDMASNVVFLSGLPLSSNALNGTSTSVVIPANTLPPGTNLQAHLSIASPDLPLTNYAYGVSTLARDTAFELVTRPAPTHPLLGIAFPRTEQMPTTTFVAETNRNYHLQTSTNLQTWTDLFVTNSAAPVLERYSESTYSLDRQRFYRVQVGP